MLQIIIFIFLESVERQFGRQLAAWKRIEPETSFSLVIPQKLVRLVKLNDENGETLKSIFHVGRDPTCAPPVDEQLKECLVFLTEQEALQRPAGNAETRGVVVAVAERHYVTN